jgi:hypothetical protein
MTPAIQRPDDITSRGVLLAEIPASEGQPYTIERRPGRVLRLARQQRNGVHVSLMLATEDAHRLAAALIESALEVE